MDPNVWYSECGTCKGRGCTDCDEGWVPHTCPLDSTDDDVAALTARDDQLKADLYRDAQIASYFRENLLDQGFTEEGAERMTRTWYENWAWPTPYD